VVLAGLQDPGNLGTILRSAEAFGATGVLSLPGTVSAWNPKAVRASAGSVFRLPLLAASAEECFAALREAGVKIWTTAVARAKPADRIDLAGRSLCSSATKATACPRSWPRRPMAHHDSLPRPGRKPERRRRRQRAALRSVAAAGSGCPILSARRKGGSRPRTLEASLEEREPMSLFDGEPEGPKGPKAPHRAAGRAHAPAQPRRVAAARSIWSAPASRCACRSSATMPAP
jgi:hypothetical protein